MDKKTLPSEESVLLRSVCAMMAIIAITASFIFGESPVPVIEFEPMQVAVIVLCIWLVVGGGVFSYHYRHSLPPVVPKLIKLGAGLIILNLARELWEANLFALQFQFLRPLMHALVAASVLTSFELKTRSDIISSATFGLLLLSVAASSGKSILFGAIVFLYICLGAALLMLSCQSQTRHESSTSKRPTLIRQTTRGTTAGATALALVLLPICSVAAFCVIPRMDNEADSVSARVRAFATAQLYSMRKAHNLEVIPNQDKIARTAGPNRLDVARRREAARLQSQLKQSEEPTPPPKQSTTPPEAASKPPATKPSAANSSTAKPSTAKPSTTKPATPKSPNSSESGTQAAPKSAGKSSAEKSADAASETVPDHVPQLSSPADEHTKSKAATKSPSKTAAKTKAKNKTASKTAAKPSENKTAQPKEKAAPKQEGDGYIHIMDEKSVNVSKGMTDLEEPLFTLACTRSVYTRFMGLDSFDGRTWQRKNIGDTWAFDPTTHGVSLMCPPLEISYAMPIMELAQTFKLQSNLGYFLPVAGIPQHVSLLEPVTVDAFGSIRAHSPLMAGSKYEVLAQLPVYALEDMRKAAPVDEDEPEGIDYYLEIPNNQSPQLFDLATEIAGTEGNRFTRAERLLHHLRKNYEYSLAPVQAPNAPNLVDAFLFDLRKGDCKSFASSFVMLCRAVEIPARCVVGYLPGDFDPVTGATHVKRKHCHAWAEVYIAPYGWVPFDATPSGLLPARPEENYYNYQRVQREMKRYTDSANSSTAAVIQTVLGWTGRILGAIGLGVAIFALYLALRASKGLLGKWIIDLRQRHPATKLKDRLVKRLRKIGVLKTPADTGADIVEKLRTCLSEKNRNPALAERVETFMDTYNAVYFGQENKMQDLVALDREISALLRSSAKFR